MADHQFELIGGEPALDFLNTIHDWTVPEPRDYLSGFPEALRFAAAAGVLSPAEVRRLAARPAGGELRRLRELRTRLERIFRVAIAGRAPPSEDLDALARDAAAAARAARLRLSRRRGVRVIDFEAAGPATLRWRIVEAAVALLTSARLARVKACPSCGWFFLDASKNRSRRWCSMATCGSSAKARRYYWRTRRPSGRDVGSPGALF
ncbi:MAG: CGNR zinc finger domain-containing protein [Gemmatimonadota bacterium]|nr:CGNR zinc finger domain-containing protein [Gemmatimonadota bacterium]